MKQRTAKLAFVHRRLWQSDLTYRVAVLLGPPPVIGFLIGAVLWAAMQAGAGRSVPGWAIPSEAVRQDDTPRTEAPVTLLQPRDAQGRLQRFTPGWLGSIHGVEVRPTLTVDVQDSALSGFALDAPDIDVERIIDKAPKAGIFVGIEAAALAIRDAGRTSLALRLDRSGGPTADCLLRLAINGHRVVSSYELNLEPSASKTLAPLEFDFRPGLYRVAAVFGCWRGPHMVGGAKLSVLIRHPGEPGLHPVGAEDILRPVTAAGPP